MYITAADLSAWNDAGEFDWEAYKAAGHHYVFFRISSGLYVDPFTQREWSRAGEAGVLRGGYHFLYPSVSIHSQADLFKSNFPSEPELGAWADVEQGFATSALEAADEGSLYWETDPGRPAEAGDIPSAFVRFRERIRNGFSMSAVASIDPQLRTFLESVDQMALHNETGIYSSQYYFQKYVGRNIDYYRERPLWTAHWNQYVSEPLIPDSFDDWVFWQVDNRSSFPGIPDPTCDLDRFEGTLESLEEWAGLEEPPPVPDCCEDHERRILLLEEKVHDHDNNPPPTGITQEFHPITGGLLLKGSVRDPELGEEGAELEQSYIVTGKWCEFIANLRFGVGEFEGSGFYWFDIVDALLPDPEYMSKAFGHFAFENFNTPVSGLATPPHGMAGWSAIWQHEGRPRIFMNVDLDKKGRVLLSSQIYRDKIDGLHRPGVFNRDMINLGVGDKLGVRIGWMLPE